MVFKLYKNKNLRIFI